MSVSYATVESEISDGLISSCQDENSVNQSTSYAQLLQNFISNNTSHPVISTCDGTCGSALPSNKLIALGRCDHYLCFSCFGQVRNSDGSFGCNSYTCNQEPSYETTTTTYTSYANDDSFSSMDVSTFQSDSDTDQYPEKNQMVLVKLILIEKNPFNATLRVHNEVEVAAKTGTREIIEGMLEEKNRASKQLLKTGKLYYLHGMKLRKLRDSENYSLFNFPQISNSVCFVLDAIGYLKEQLVNISFECE